MSTRKLEISGGMIKSIRRGSIRMTGITGNAVVNVTVRLLMTFIHQSLAMIMAIHTGVFGKITTLIMAFRTIAPGIGMGTRVYWKILIIMLLVFCRLPFWIGRMAFGTIGGYTVLLMIGYRGGIVIRFMARKTISRNFCIFSRYMA